MSKLKCDSKQCTSIDIDKGRDIRRRRVYRCNVCGCIWVVNFGAKKRYSFQRQGYQFKDTGASRQCK